MTRVKTPIVIIGAGYTGLTAAYQLSKAGYSVTVLEKETTVGGLAGSFNIGGQPLEKFYHHWFNNDKHILELVRDLNAEDQIVARSTSTGIYITNRYFKLSSPVDVLRFQPLSLVERFRLGWLVIQARRVKNWRALESLTAEEWLIQMGGQKVFEIVWKPLLEGKFGPFAASISAVWFWNKLKLRGGSRNKGGGEELLYYRGGFAALADLIVMEINNHGGQVLTETAADALIVDQGKIIAVKANGTEYPANAVISTTPLPDIANQLEPFVGNDYITHLRKIRYLANICLVLELDRSLSETYWLNINDPGFPFVGIIEHTNFEPRECYGGRHIVYLSKYLPESDALFSMNRDELLHYCLPFVQMIFPEFRLTWIQAYHVWRARYSQPVVERYYSRLIPDHKTPVDGFFIATMAQIYPQDRGTNYAVREGRKIADLVSNFLNSTVNGQPDSAA